MTIFLENNKAITRKCCKGCKAMLGKILIGLPNLKHNHNQNSEAQLRVCEFRPIAKNRSQVDRCELGKILKEELAKIVQKYSIDYDIDENAR